VAVLVDVEVSVTVGVKVGDMELVEVGVWL